MAVPQLDKYILHTALKDMILLDCIAITETTSLIPPREKKKFSNMCANMQLLPT